VARSIDVDRGHLTDVLRQAAAHPGTAFVEIYQNCNVFNDEAFIALTGKDSKALFSQAWSHNGLPERQ